MRPRSRSSSGNVCQLHHRPCGLHNCCPFCPLSNDIASSLAAVASPILQPSVIIHRRLRRSCVQGAVPAASWGFLIFLKSSNASEQPRSSATLPMTFQKIPRDWAGILKQQVEVPLALLDANVPTVLFLGLNCFGGSPSQQWHRSQTIVRMRWIIP